ncbi:hypothetical protein D3C76_1022360 [compost metagenome]
MAGEAESLKMLIAILINHICDGKMQQIPVLMEPVMTHLFQIEHPQYTRSKIVSGRIGADQRQKSLVGLIFEAALNDRQIDFLL